jgi:hypothetical protein
MPTKRRPIETEATAVVPEPLKGSSTMSPGLDPARMMRSSSASGFCVGWRPLAFSRLAGVGSDHTTCSPSGSGNCHRSRICLPPFSAFISR